MPRHRRSTTCSWNTWGNGNRLPGRASFYGRPDYCEKANETTLDIAMIETRAAIESLVDIVTTPCVGRSLHRPQ